MRSALNLAVRALATYRLTKLVIDDKITEDLREIVYQRYGSPDDHKLSYFTTCPWCVSVYAAALLSGVHMMAPNNKLVRAGTEALALSAVAGMVYEREGSRF